MLIAGLETVITYMVAYPAALALGVVLMQTAPQRGLPGGQTEALSRLIQEVCPALSFYFHLTDAYFAFNS